MGTHVFIRFAVGAAVVLTLAGCGTNTKTTAGSSVPAASASSEATSAASSSAAPPPVTAASPSGPAAVPPTGEKPTREFVVGKWGTDGDCMLAIELRPDGTSDGPFGNWDYTDGVISFPDDPEFKVNVTVIDGNTMASTNDVGKVTKMTRCP